MGDLCLVDHLMDHLIMKDLCEKVYADPQCEYVIIVCRYL